MGSQKKNAILPLNFYNRPALTVARELLGRVLVIEDAGGRRAGRVVETEAYIGEHDLACHAAKGRTARTEVLFGPPGVAYVYLIYGMYHCFNVVTEPQDIAAAVLIRGLEPLEGLSAGARTDGPGRLCRAMGITLAHNRVSLEGPLIYLEDAPAMASRRIQKGPRIGVDYAGIWARKPYRFWVRGSSHVSRPR